MTKGDGHGGAEHKSAWRLKRRRKSIFLTEMTEKLRNNWHFRSADEIIKRNRNIDRIDRKKKRNKIVMVQMPRNVSTRPTKAQMI